MSKKHFEALTCALAQARPVPWPAWGVHAYQVWLSVCQAVAGVCLENNPKFDRERFIEACKTYPVKEQEREAGSRQV